MIAPVTGVEEGATVAAAKARLLRARINAAPVLAASGEAVGAVTRQMLDAALQHGLGERPVATVMRQDLEWVGPDEPADELAPRMVGERPRFLLVGRARQRACRSASSRAWPCCATSTGASSRPPSRWSGARASSAPGGRGSGPCWRSGCPPALRARIEGIAAVSRESGVGGLPRGRLRARPAARARGPRPRRRGGRGRSGFRAPAGRARSAGACASTRRSSPRW